MFESISKPSFLVCHSRPIRNKRGYWVPKWDLELLPQTQQKVRMSAALWHLPSSHLYVHVHTCPSRPGTGPALTSVGGDLVAFFQAQAAGRGGGPESLFAWPVAQHSHVQARCREALAAVCCVPTSS